MANVAKILQNFIATRREMWLHWAVWFLLVFTGIISAAAYLTAAHPAAGEIMQGALIKFGLVVNYGLVISAVLVFLSYMLHTAGKDITVTFYPVGQIGAAPAPLALPEYTAGNDILVIAKPDQSPEDWAAAVDSAEKQANRARWGVVIPFRSPVFHLFTGTTAEIYSRDEPLFLMPETFPDFDGRVCSARVFTQETPEDYAAYCERFCRIFREWAPREKAARAAGRSVGALLEVVKNSANILLLLLIALPAFSQSKTRQVDEVLGTRIREIPKAGEEISFVFDLNGNTKSFNRVGDGRSEYTDLLRNVPGLGGFNDEGGRLLYITKGGEVVAKADGVERVNSNRGGQPVYLEESTTGDPIRPRGTSAIAPETLDESWRFALPDSASVAETIERGKEAWDYRRSELWQVVQPVWAGVMYLFFSIVPLFVCLGGLFNYVSGTAAGEGFYGLSVVGNVIRRMHEAASGATLLICWAITIVLLIDLFMFFVYKGISLWWLMVCWFPAVWIAKRLTNWLVPNPPGFRPAFTPSNNRPASAPSNRQLLG